MSEISSSKWCEDNIKDFGFSDIYYSHYALFPFFLKLKTFDDGWVTVLHIPLTLKMERLEEPPYTDTSFAKRSLRYTSKCEGYLDYESMINFVRYALWYARRNPSNDVHGRRIKIAATEFFHKICEDFGRKQLRHKCAQRIQKQWRESINNPSYLLCRNRLAREFNELESNSNF